MSSEAKRRRRLRIVVASAVAIACLFAAIPRAAAPSLDEVQSLLKAGKFADAERLARTLLLETEKTHGTESLEVAEVLDTLGEAMRRNGKGGQPETRQAFERAIAIKDKVVGRDDPRYAASLYQLGFLLYLNTDYAGAKPLLERALAIQEATLEANHPHVAASVLALGALSSDVGDDAAAEAMFERACRIRETAFGPESPEVAECLEAIATVRYRVGDFAGSVALHEKALRSFERSMGPNYHKVATCLHNLGAVLAETGDYDGAIACTERALRIRLGVYGPDHEFVFTCVGNLGSYQALKGNLAEARRRYDEALPVGEARFGAESSEVGWILTRLGLLCLQQDRFREAKPYLERAKRNIEQDLGPDHPDLADALAALATANAAEGDTATAWLLYERAIAIRAKALGPAHPDVGFVLTEYARTLEACGQHAAALDVGLRGEEISREHLRLTSRSFTERHALDYAASRPAGIRVAVSALLGMPGAPPETIAKVWDSLVRSRTLVLDEMAFRNRSVAEEGDSEAVRLSIDLASGRRRLANLLVAGPGGDPAERYRATVARTREETERIERALAARSAAFRSEQERSRIGYREVAPSLPPDCALVAYTTAGDSANLSYLAFVLPAEEVSRAGQAAPPGRAAPSVVRLGPAEKIDDAILRWLADVNRSGLALAGGSAGEQASRASGAVVRRLVWDPLADRVRGAHRVFIVPEGTINLMSFAALPTGRATYLLETIADLHYLSAERDLVPGSIPASRGIGLLAVGDPNFDGGGAGSGGAGDGSFASHRFRALPHSGREARDVAAIWGKPAETVLLTGAHATEAAFKSNASRRRVLHLATHGFFIAGEYRRGPGTTRGIGGVAPSARPRKSGHSGDSPLLLAGLALAGANRRALAKPDEEDGILTAEEIASLGLTGVEWAVLSACDTGRGRVRAGEGVLGLRRAFQLAGAATVIMSLWEVEDESAGIWMKTLYECRVTEKLDTADAVARASLRVLRERRAQARSTDPFYWAAFVAAGDWR